MTLAATYYGANGWLLEFDDLRVLVDPWLRGSLSFPPGEWLLKGELPHDRDTPKNLNLLLLTQGLADHAHPETLALLPKDLPVIGSMAATQVVGRLGFTNVKALSPGESTSHQGLQVRASAGAPVPMVENGYLLEHPAGSLYLEPHGFLDPALEPQPLDAVITPMVDLGLPALGAFVKGCTVVGWKRSTSCGTTEQPLTNAPSAGSPRSTIGVITASSGCGSRAGSRKPWGSR